MDREELLRSARNLYENPGTNEALKVVLEETYPELKESEDERIRKSLIKSFTNQHSANFPTVDGFTREQIIAYLEKQKEQQPEVDIEKEIDEHAENMPHGEFTHESECIEHEEWAKREFRHFYELGLNARKK